MVGAEPSGGVAAATEARRAQVEARILAAIVNEAASAIADGVATPDAVDTAMRRGTNWPDGPLAWGRIGLASVVHTLDALHAAVPDGDTAPSRSCARVRVRRLLLRAILSMPLSGRYRAVIFDMDGLLLDTETLWHAAEVDLFHRHGGEFTWDDKMAVIGTSYDFTADYFADRSAGRAPRARRWSRRWSPACTSACCRRGSATGRRRARRAAARDRCPPRTRLELARILVDDALRTRTARCLRGDRHLGRRRACQPAPDIYLLACERWESTDDARVEDSSA